MNKHVFILLFLMTLSLSGCMDYLTRQIAEDHKDKVREPEPYEPMSGFLNGEPFQADPYKRTFIIRDPLGHIDEYPDSVSRMSYGRNLWNMDGVEIAHLNLHVTIKEKVKLNKKYPLNLSTELLYRDEEAEVNRRPNAESGWILFTEYTVDGLHDIYISGEFEVKFNSPVEGEEGFEITEGVFGPLRLSYWMTTDVNYRDVY